MADAESSGFMIKNTYSIPSSKYLDSIPQEFGGCACPRARSLVSEIFRPHEPGYFAFKNHLMQPTIFEFGQGHISELQLHSLYVQLKKSNDENLSACDLAGQSGNEEDFAKIKQGLDSQFKKLSSHFESMCRPLKKSIFEGDLVMQPLCNEVFKPQIIGK